MNIMMCWFLISGHFCSWGSRTWWMCMKKLGFRFQNDVWSLQRVFAWIWLFVSMYWTTCLLLGTLIGHERLMVPHPLKWNGAFHWSALNISKSNSLRIRAKAFPKLAFCILSIYSICHSCYVLHVFLFFSSLPKIITQSMMIQMMCGFLHLVPHNV
jgi:hypothetical protein